MSVAGGFWGHEHFIHDRHFISKILSPALCEYYRENKERAWTFISSHCVTKTSKVNIEKPDFLNRASIKVLFERFNSPEKARSDEAYKVLKEFTLSRKGFHKSELIC